MPQFLVLAENENLLQTWEIILRLSTDLTLETVILKDFSTENVNISELEVVFFATEGLTDTVKSYLKFFKEHSIPIICTEREVPKGLSNDEIVDMGIRATISEHFSILTLLELIRFVCNGGIYTDSKR